MENQIQHLKNIAMEAPAIAIPDIEDVEVVFAFTKAFQFCFQLCCLLDKWSTFFFKFRNTISSDVFVFDRSQGYFQTFAEYVELFLPFERNTFSFLFLMTRSIHYNKQKNQT